MRKLYRNPLNGYLFGVCAGLADYWGVKVSVIRFLWIMAFFFSYGTAVLVYVILGLFLEIDPNIERAFAFNREQAKNASAAMDEHLAAIEKKLQNLQEKVENIEDYITSDTFDLQRKIWTMQSYKK